MLRRGMRKRRSMDRKRGKLRLTLVNIGSSGQARVLLPNAAQPQNYLAAGQTVVFPGVGSQLTVTPVGPAGVVTVMTLGGWQVPFPI